MLLNKEISLLIKILTGVNALNNKENEFLNN